MTTHYLDDTVTQPFWDNSAEPRLTIEPGDTVVFECLEATGQLTPDDDQQLRADVAPFNGSYPEPDGLINAGDLVRIQRMALGL